MKFTYGKNYSSELSPLSMSINHSEGFKGMKL